MPTEFTLLAGARVPLGACPHCGAAPFVPFLRGIVQRNVHAWGGRRQDYCALICSTCKDIVGYESPVIEPESLLETLIPLFLFYLGIGLGTLAFALLVLIL